MITLSKIDRPLGDNVIPLRPNEHRVHLDASQLVSRGVRAMCICGTVAEGLRGAVEVLEFMRSHRVGPDE